MGLLDKIFKPSAKAEDVREYLNVELEHDNTIITNSRLNKEYELMSEDIVDTLINIHDKEIESEGKGRCFELFLGDLFRLSGYEVEVTPYIGDGGVDLYLSKNGVTTAIQAKKCKLEKTSVMRVAELREFKGALKQGERGVFITTHYFSPDAIEFAEKNKIELIDKEGLIMLIAQLQPMLLAKAYYEKMVEDFSRCPKCGSIMIKKWKGSCFWGCVKFPLCKGTKPFNSTK